MSAGRSRGGMPDRRCSDTSVPSDPGAVELARGHSAVDQTVQVRDALAGRHTEEIHGHAPVKQDTEDIDGPLRLDELPVQTE